MLEMHQAVALFKTNKIEGEVVASDHRRGCKIVATFTKLPSGKHGFHIHESGDLREGCKSCCAHYNPTDAEHGDLQDENSHIGDLGNITTDENGNCEMKLKSNKFIIDDILGRSIIIHEDEDDLGKGGFEDSKTTGHSGARIACSVIGISSEGFR